MIKSSSPKEIKESRSETQKSVHVVDDKRLHPRPNPVHLQWLLGSSSSAKCIWPWAKNQKTIFMSHLILPLTTNYPPVSHLISLRFSFFTFHMTILSSWPLAVDSCEAQYNLFNICEKFFKKYKVLNKWKVLFGLKSSPDMLIYIEFKAMAVTKFF